MSFKHRGEAARTHPDLEARLRALEHEAELALPGLDAQYFNRAGDVCMAAGERGRALAYFGRAIDAYLRAGRYNAAGAVCRKLLRASPDSVRARATLAWLSIGKGLISEAQWEVEEYVKAAEAAGQQELARKHVRLMASATYSAELRMLLADQLRRLGDADGARAIVEAPQVDAGSREEAEALWSRVLRAALMGPED